MYVYTLPIITLEAPLIIFSVRCVVELRIFCRNSCFFLSMCVLSTMVLYHTYQGIAIIVWWVGYVYLCLKREREYVCSMYVCREDVGHYSLFLIPPFDGA